MNTADQYVKAIYLLQEMEDGPAATGALADMLDVSPASANEMIGKLEDRGLAEHEKYKGVRLTDEGIIRARDALQTYCIIERFLANVLDVEEFRSEARELEPVIDDTVAERLDTIIDRNSECPDCFDPETDACCYLELASEPEEKPAD
ncbi:metal-dependent transcriptional regulator [Halogeometricum borinquense]|uniref:Mn-dependent transcriptional regulator n=2 Tax=Halogeometricum borinquense TaxID=60847 RepID=E4NQW8_HALBP|nr:metal-dependent transcriptional regulator [Halogeometricum borinquense]ADQ67915.1 Mn-dependent transcriptional regulator [Halogeometricum borinquense DSM 11551]ELY24165.1 mn-dependent transcriptional regulator [Halogeometricum borinquense DSM 11551]QIB73471.1 metal-dependent transcriptional regulator [Halogeometricum borinquense]QIQ77127.1 metal-dependent transcriptional regulator [Halogeometricum borinquense]RYJ13192.1 metal-dependent transcriptional regulator [Halogeometricum borinquense]